MKWPHSVYNRECGHFISWCARRGPPVGGVCLRKATAFSQTRGSVPIAARPSIRCGRLIKCALPTSRAQRTFQQRSQTVNALKHRRYNKSTFSAGAHSPMTDWMDWCLQTHPPRTACVGLCLQGSIPCLMTLRAPKHACCIMHT